MELKLYEIAAAYNQLEVLASDPDTGSVEIEKWLDECTDALHDKCTNIVMFVENLDSTAAAIKDAEKRMSERRKAIENRVSSIKAYVLRSMQNNDITKIECDLFKISRQKNPASIVIDDEKAVPIRYWKQPEPPEPTIDKRAILDDIKQGVVVDGAHMEQLERLVIR